MFPPPSSRFPIVTRSPRTQSQKAWIVRTVQDLEATNAADRSQIAALRRQIGALEADAAARSADTQALQSPVADLRAHAGLVAMHGPGVEVKLRNGLAGLNAASRTS